MWESISERKVISKPSYADAIRHKASNKEAMSRTPHPRWMGSHRGSRYFQGYSFPQSKPRMKKHGEEGEVKSVSPAMNSEEPVQINDEAKRVASTNRLSDSLDIDGTNLEKGLEEHVGLAISLMTTIAFFFWS
ncbi:hypothetical protein Ancab_021164 [Ancistrocladus abbreviatus]